ncbi:TOMM precursor leader peptide-binding protein [Lyngbya aestuarii]|uniref:TOMM precursor leader peptide-binding protein n=1 Tax=Lyngbya aestuarii TaxID=118322 RepID=UPI00403D9CC6
MINRPKFKSCFHIEIVESNVFLLSEQDCFLLSGHLYGLLTPLINGKHTVDEIVEFLQEKASAAEVYYALMLMEQKGYLVESQAVISSSVEAFWELLQVTPQAAISKLNSTKVSLHTFGKVPGQEFIATLESLNIQVSSDGDLGIVVTDDYLQEGLTEFNQKSLFLQRPWILVKPVGATIWIGPIFYPGKTGCWECLAQRLRANRPVESYIRKQKGISIPLPTSLAMLPSTWQTGLNLAATEIAKWIVQEENKQLEDVLITFNTFSLKTESHILVKRPQCPSCGNPGQFSREPSPVILESRHKTFTSDGGHRCFSPEETFEKYQHHISSITGVIQTLKPYYQQEKGVLHSYTAGHNSAIKSGSLYLLRETIRGRSGGKGKTDIQAKVSAVCEAIERYSGVFQGDEIRQKDTYLNLGSAAVHPQSFLNFSEEQYKNRRQENDKLAPYLRVPEPFDETKEIEWTPVWSLTNQEFKYLPTAYCYYSYPKKQNPFCWANSNGSAAGNTKEEAIFQGFMELVERDSVALWWYNRVKRPAIDLDSFDEPYFQAIKDYYKTLNRELWVLDITADLNIPVFAAISRRMDRENEDIIFGFGAHFDAKMAILRAITEAGQILPGVLTSTADGSTKYTFTDEVALDWWQKATIENQPYLVPDSSLKPKAYSDYPQRWSDDCKEDVMACVDIAEKHGMEVLVLDQTRPDIGLNVVKVTVPGMRHFWKRLGPGRLYEVPVKLGWLPKSLREDQLNSFPMFI